MARVVAAVQPRSAEGACGRQGQQAGGLQLLPCPRPARRFAKRLVSNQQRRPCAVRAQVQATEETEATTSPTVGDEDVGMHNAPAKEPYRSPVPTVEILHLNVAASSNGSTFSSLPLCLYFPAIDGQGLTANSQFQRLSTAFDFFSLRLDKTDRSSFKTLVRIASDFLRDQLKDSPPERPVYVMGDSWGALLALSTALEVPSLVHRVILISPMTSEPDETWAQVARVAAPALALVGPLPTNLQRALPLALGPVLGNPLRLAANWVDLGANSTPQDLASGLAQAARAMMDQAGELGEQLPPATLDWRMTMMRTAMKGMKSNLRKVEQRALIVIGEEDALMSSVKEAERLVGSLKRASFRALPRSGHSLLQERGVDLLSLLEEEGFYVKKRKFTSKPSTRVVGNNFGKAGPLELPTPQELDRTFDSQYKQLATATSPVFFSEAADGMIMQGLDNVISTTDRPILLVGNHQLMGLDMSFMIREFLVEKGRLMRGLAHPLIFSQSSEGEDDGGTNGFSGMQSTFTSFGSVPVGPTALFRLMKDKEMVLLFPGGAREALKKRGEKYQLIWPEQPEFVRMAARCGAMIVPFSAIGSEDSLQYVMDSQEVMDNPEVISQLFGKNSAGIIDALKNTQARRGVNAGAIDDYLVPPIVAPSVPSRFYYLFKKPIVLEPEDAKDREKVESVYKTVKIEVETGLAYLIKKREVDPYKDFLPRVAYETVSKEQAPTFTP